MPLSLFNPWVLLGAILAAAGIWMHGYSSNDDAEKVQAAWDQANVLAEGARTARIAQARENERLLRVADEKERKEAHAKQSAVIAGYERVVRELRNRPARPSEPGRDDVVHQGAASPGPEDRRGSTGADLYRDDAEFLARFAKTASLIRDQRDRCYAQYARAQEALKNQGKPRDSP